MLQWMGGSRHKVTTSRKSTQKRQKQYFEQRKRQQQQQQMTGVDIFSDGTTPCTQRQDTNRSLDILSLLNLPTVVQNSNPSCYSARETSGGNEKLNYHTTKGQPTIRAAKVTPVDPVEFREASDLSGCQVEIVYPKKVLSSAHDIQSRDAPENGDTTDKLKLANERRNPTRCYSETIFQKKVFSSSTGGQNVDSIRFRGSDRTDKWKTASEHKLSVFDLLGDDGPHDNLEENPTREAHVAFAMEGLGQVGTETPVHSPDQPIRKFSYGPSSPLKVTRQSHSSKNVNNVLSDLEIEAAAMTQDTDMPHYGSFLEPPFCSRGTFNSISKPREMLSTAEEFSQFNTNTIRLKNSFADDEIFWNIDDKSDDIWDDDASPYEGCYISWKNMPFRMGSSADCWDLGNHEMPDFNSKGSYAQKISGAEKATSNFNISESAAPFCKQQRAEKDHNLRTSDGIWSLTGGRNYGVRYVTNQPAWSPYITEDVEDSLSLLSEESCSSSAARGKATKRQPSSSVLNQNMGSRHDTDIRNPVKKGSFGNIYRNRHYEKRDDFYGGKKINEPGMFPKICNSSSPNPAHISNNMFKKKFKPENRFLFEEGFIYTDMDSEFSSFCGASEAKEHAPSVPNLWCEDPLCAYSDPNLHADIKSTYERSKHGLPLRSDFSLETRTFCQPSSHVYSYESPIFTTLGSCMDTKVGTPRNVSPFTGSWRDAEFLYVSKEECVGIDEEDESKLEATGLVQLEVKKDACIGSNDLSSEGGRPSEASDTKDNCGTSNKANELTSETEDRKATYSPKHVEENASSLKILDEFKEENHNDAQTYLPHQDRSTGVENSALKEGKLENAGGKIGLISSYQVMLESYGLQLLCVQKVLKEASMHDPGKKGWRGAMNDRDCSTRVKNLMHNSSYARVEHS